MVKSMKTLLAVSIAAVVMTGCESSGTTETSVEDTQSAVSDAQAAADAAARQAAADAEAAEKAACSSADKVFYFDFDQSLLGAESRAALLVQAECLKKYGSSIRLEGHADERGSREYNMALGERRANAVRDFLVLNGVSSSDVEPISYGEERPVATGSNEMSYAKNRRVELK